MILVDDGSELAVCNYRYVDENGREIPERAGRSPITRGADIDHLKLIYLLYLIQSASSYLISYKNSILLAYQKAYVRLLWEQVFKLVQIVGQIIALVLTGSFILYLAIQLVSQFMINVAVSVKVDKDYPYLKGCRKFPSKAECRHIVKNIGAMSLHRLVKYFANYGVRTVSVCAAYGAAYMLCRGFVDNGILGFVGGGLLYTAIFAAIAWVLYGRTPEFKYFMQMMEKRKQK